MARFYKLENFMDEQNALPLGTQRFRRNTTAYKLAVEAVQNYPAQVNTVKQTGGGKYTRYEDNTSQTFMLLKMAGFLPTTGNNSPRGGRLGNYVHLPVCKENFVARNAQEQLPDIHPDMCAVRCDGAPKFQEKWIDEKVFHSSNVIGKGVWLFPDGKIIEIL